MEDMWDTIEEIIGSDIAYAKFRARTKKFMLANPMTYNEFSLNAGVSATILIAFVRDGYRRLSFKTISKILNFMADYRK